MSVLLKDESKSALIRVLSISNSTRLYSYEVQERREPTLATSSSARSRLSTNSIPRSLEQTLEITDLQI